MLSESAKALAATFHLTSTFNSLIEKKEKTLPALYKNNVISTIRNKKLLSTSSLPLFFSPVESSMDTLKNMYTNILFRCGYEPRLKESQRKKILVLGTGWGSMNFIRHLDVTKYDVTVVSPRNYFTFTPLLPSVCAGVLTARSCLEPVRDHLCRGGKKVMDFYEAWATEIDSTKKSVKCKGLTGEEFSLDYDYLVMGVGSAVNTFGIPGVEEHAYYLKEVTDAKDIHTKLLDCFERASLPTTTIEQKKKLLSFVMVGGGPSGVETAAEVADMVQKDAKKHFPELVPFVQVTLIEMLPRVLPIFSPQVSEYTLETLKKIHVDVRLKSRVTKITKDAVHIVDDKDVVQELPYGFVLWASGVGQVPLIKHVLTTVSSQASNRIMKVDEKLQVIGLPDCYAIGDCTWLSPRKIETDAEELYQKAKKAGDVSAQWIKKSLKQLIKEYPQFASYDLKKLPQTLVMTKAEFIEMLKSIDTSYSPPPPTAQAASQAAIYLSKTFNKFMFDEQKKSKAPAFVYRWKGQMSYVGGGNSVIQTPLGTVLGGIFSHTFWKSLYCIRQMSFTNKFLCVFDWLRTGLRGRDVGRDHSKTSIEKRITAI